MATFGKDEPNETTLISQPCWGDAHNAFIARFKP
jgi:hypothetical protein